MKKIWVVIFSLFALGSFSSASAEKIEDFTAEILLKKDSSFLVKESIRWNFGNLQRHGIFREIPTKGIKIKFEKVTDELDNQYPVEVKQEKERLRVKIGDPNILVSGIKIYNIFYTIQNGISFFKDHDELYWNVTGNEWQVPIEKAKAKVILPQETEGIKADCFTGYFGEKSRNCDFEVIDKKTIIFSTRKNLSPREGLTIVVGIPKGILKEPNIFLKILWNLKIYWFVFIPIFTFIYLFQEWWTKGRDPSIKKAIVPQYEPPKDLKVAEVALLLKQKIEPRDITAALIDLATRGYIKIREVKKEGIFGGKDFEIEELKEDENLVNYERLLLEKIFKSQKKILISSLKNHFYKDFELICSSICEELTKAKYFERNPQKAKRKWFSIGTAFIFIVWVFFAFFKNLFFSFSLLLTGILFFIFAPLMPKRSEKGTETFWHILGFKEYIKTAEKYRAQFYEKENIFEKYLPYAISFDLVDKWASAFEGIYKNPPNWYEGYYYRGVFSSREFSKHLNSTISSMGGIIVSKPGGRTSGFGGGGFSGGGAGGGGGGSW